MKKILKWLFESNRYKHFIGGAIWSLFVTTYALIANSPTWTAYWVGVISTLGLALALEFKDMQHGGEPDAIDITMTQIGAIIASLIPVIIVTL